MVARVASFAQDRQLKMQSAWNGEGPDAAVHAAHAEQDFPASKEYFKQREQDAVARAILRAISWLEQHSKPSSSTVETGLS